MPPVQQAPSVDGQTAPRQPRPAPTITTTMPAPDLPKSGATETVTPLPSLTPAPGPVQKADTGMTWGEPVGLHIRGSNDENLMIFRRAVGINVTLPGSADSRSLEEGRKSAVGIYAATLSMQRSKQMMYQIFTVLIYLSHFSQIIIGASLTALGPSAGNFTLTITTLGAINTIVAGILALVKGQGLPERLRQDQAEFRKLQDWIEQTESLLTVGVIGRNRKEVGLLVQVAFHKYNAVRASEDNNVPENYVRAPEGTVERSRPTSSEGPKPSAP
ncbi:hypothetical protein B0T22DRAFT_380468 [Podospora appendiculata]|uniref:SMODS and SLOG-associating 2TM effector domain-containing protein n=1 Tax=Podospora appendiculata TaxID=314037 RepID=A0AAE0X9I1_9PEZI|nr:hypothetical protein B0T22DRAFT_380468 [Podospora appendiculata]